MIILVDLCIKEKEKIVTTTVTRLRKTEMTHLRLQ